MNTIKPLPQSLSSTVRSGIVLFDLTRVVEELLLNSLDAAATKVSVFIGVGTLSLKVVDNGSGVTRDDLALLGERYATSKRERAGDIGTSCGTFGSRGEALASLSDVSLIEIITKTHGSPNGYRKVLKGCKCLHLGINDDVKDVGTTVIVRDLFYNQPIRRKHIHSSPRKVLDSIKKCVLRIALVHTEISFKLIDIESGNELLCTQPSSSPLSLLRRTFGIDICNALNELMASEGVLNLTGFVSGPCNDFDFKAFQYVYINSQFICKGPIHKVVNQLAAKFESSDSVKGASDVPNGKRSRIQACPAFLLRLNCPRSLYDLNFEPSKTCVEFKDWNPILTFVESAVQHFWKGRLTEGRCSPKFSGASGENFGTTVSAREGGILHGNFEPAKKKFRLIRDDPLLAFVPDFPNKETDLFPQVERFASPFLEYDQSPLKPEEQNKVDWFLHNNQFHHQDCSRIVKCVSSGVSSGEEYQCIFDDTFCFNGSRSRCAEVNFLREGQRHGVNYFSLPKIEDSRDIDSIISDELGLRTFSSKSPEDFLMRRDRRKPFLQGCSSQEKLALPGMYFESDRRFEIDDHDDLNRRLRIDSSNDDIHLPKFLPMMSCHEEECDPAVINVDTSCTRSSMEEHSSRWSRDFTGMQNVSASGCLLDSDWSSVISSPILSDTWDRQFQVEGTAARSSLSSNQVSYGRPPDKMSCKSWVRDKTSKFHRAEDIELNNNKGNRHKRSHSAPPFHRRKRLFDSLSYLRLMDRKEPDTRTCLDGFSAPETVKPESKISNCSTSNQHISAESFLDCRQEMHKHSEVDPAATENDKDSGQIQDSRDSVIKWRETCLQKRSTPFRILEEKRILDISSGFLYLAGDSLVPKCISKDCLLNAKVLQQVDKKFIPVVAGGTLAVIDQHAADERIRLEDLRQKVLSGEAKTISYLDSEKELLLPEIGYQLLHDYREQIQEWGWICDIHSQCSGSFSKNLNLINRQRASIKLLAVPCILGVNLTDADLLEFIQQLADTDGASTVPPAVLRVLNLKACRGAIMFGDALLPSECSLIVEELKQTTLCFQCAHGRPTTVPLVNLEALRKQIPKLCGVNDNSNEAWHGLSSHGLSLQRSARRLRSATE